MSELLTAAQMRAIEQAAIESGEVTGLELMERAGQGVVEAILDEWPELAERGRRAAVLCGPGNNGGDGFVVARLMKERGWEVEAFSYGDAEKLPPDAKTNYKRWSELGEVGALETASFPFPHDKHFDLVCDALFGTGLTRPVSGEAAKILGKIRASIWPYERSLRPQERLVAVDIPTSLCSDSGEVLGDGEANLSHFRADLTVTFHSEKVGHYLKDGPELTGKIVVKDIGLVDKNRSRREAVRLVNSSCSQLMKEPFHHKYQHGHALVLSGGHGNTGAARLAARGALRIGAGLVTLGSPRSAMFENAANLTAIMLRQIDGAAGLRELLEDARYNALCLGPGLGIRADTQALVLAVLKEKRPTVLDADALNRFSAKPEVLFDVLHKDCVITPHGGEFTRLFPDIAEKLAAPATTGPAYSKVDATRDAATRAGCVVLFKGADTVIAAPDGRCSVNSAQYERSAPWLATAGSGDVLAGFIAGLMARGFAPMQAAETGAWLHVECARKFGPGLIAEDLADQLPSVFRDLGL